MKALAEAVKFPDLPLKNISGGNTSITASELPKVFTVVLLRIVFEGNFYWIGCSFDACRGRLDIFTLEALNEYNFLTI